MRSETEIKTLEEKLARLELERQRLESFMSAHDQLTQMVLDGHNLESITKRLGYLMQTSVEIEDRFHSLLAVFSWENIADTYHRHRQETRFNQSSELKQQIQPYFEQARTEHCTVIMPIIAGLGLERSRLLVPISVENELLGYVCLLDKKGGFSRGMTRAAEHSALIFALLMMKGKHEAEVERRLQADFVEELIGGKVLDETSLLHRGGYFGFNPAMAYRLIMVDIDDFAATIEKLDWDESFVRSFKRQLFAELSILVNALSPHSLLLSKSDSITLLAPLANGTKEKKSGEVFFEELANRIQRLITRLCPDITASIVLGGNCRRPPDFTKAAERAQRCLNLARLLGQREQILSYDKLGIYTVLFERENQQTLFEFARDQLAALQSG